MATIFPLNLLERLNRCTSCDVRSREDGDINFLAKFSEKLNSRIGNMKAISPLHLVEEIVLARKSRAVS